MLVRSLLSIFLILTARLGFSASGDPATPAKPKPSALDLQRDSLSRQRDSLRKQLGAKPEEVHSDFEFLLPPMDPLPAPDCPALAKDQVESLIKGAAKKSSLEPDLIRAVMRQESAFNPCAVSAKGAQGLMQLMPATAAQLHVADPFDPEQNVQAGAAFLKQLLKRYNGDLRLALVAYNAGASRAEQPATPYPAETQGYLANIFAELGMDQTSPVKDEPPAPADPAPSDPPTPNQ